MAGWRGKKHHQALPLLTASNVSGLFLYPGQLKVETGSSSSEGAAVGSVQHTSCANREKLRGCGLSLVATFSGLPYRYILPIIRALKNAHTLTADNLARGVIYDCGEQHDAIMADHHHI